MQGPPQSTPFGFSGYCYEKILKNSLHLVFKIILFSPFINVLSRRQNELCFRSTRSLDFFFNWYQVLILIKSRVSDNMYNAMNPEKKGCFWSVTQATTLNPISRDLLISSDVSVASIVLWDFILNRAFKDALFPALLTHLLGYLPVSHPLPMKASLQLVFLPELLFNVGLVHRPYPPLGSPPMLPPFSLRPAPTFLVVVVQSPICVQLFGTLCPWPSPSPRVCPNSRPFHRWCHPAPVMLFSFCLQFFPASGSFPMSQFFPLGGQNIAASASVLQWIFRVDFLNDWLVWSPCSPRDSQESSPVPQFESINSLAVCLLYGPTLTTIRNYWKDHSPDYMGFVWQSDVFAYQHNVWVCCSFPAKQQSSSNFKAAVTICSDVGTQEEEICHCFCLYPLYLPWSIRTLQYDLSVLCGPAWCGS